MQVDVILLNDNAKLPERGSEFAAGYDIYACETEDITIAPHETKLIHTGLTFAIDDGYYGAIYARSGIAAKEGLRPANCVGVIDSDYRGEIMVALHNDSLEERVITNHQKVAQIIISPYEKVEFNVVKNMSETARGAGGFGSSGR